MLYYLYINKLNKINYMYTPNIKKKVYVKSEGNIF